MSAQAATAEAPMLAWLAQCFERRVATLAENIDESWRKNGEDASAWLDQPGDASLRKRLESASRLYIRSCRTWPSLLDLVQPASRLSLLDRAPLHMRLCALALQARPGAVRCCVERQVREALAACLGPAYGRLREKPAAATPLPPAAARWSPLEWACVGYADLEHAKAWPHDGLRRLVRLALPRRWTVGRSHKAHPQPQLQAMEALAELDTLFEERH